MKEADDMEAAMAAEYGFTAEDRIFEMPGGFCETYGAPDSNSSANIVADLGQEWDIVTDMAIKLMPGTASNPAFRRIDVDVATGKVQGLF